MSDEQWLWLFINQQIDNDEKLEHMCPECRNAVISHNKCTRCGKPLTEKAEEVSTTFDEEKYNRLKAEQESMYDPDGLWGLDEDDGQEDEDGDIVYEIGREEFNDNSSDWNEDEEE